MLSTLHRRVSHLLHTNLYVKRLHPTLDRLHGRRQRGHDCRRDRCFENALDDDSGDGNTAADDDDRWQRPQRHRPQIVKKKKTWTIDDDDGDNLHDRQRQRLRRRLATTATTTRTDDHDAYGDQDCDSAFMRPWIPARNQARR